MANPFPIGPAGFVEMDVRVDQAGEDVQAARRSPAFAAGELRRDLDDRFAVDGDVGDGDAVVADHRSVTDDQVHSH